MDVIKVSKDIEDIFPFFLEERKKDIILLKEAFEKNDYNIIETIGHRLAGNAPGYGVNGLGEIGVQLEEASFKQNTSEVESLIYRYEKFLENMKVEFV